MKILVCEDNRELLSSFKRGLSLFNYDVDTVFDGVQVIENLSTIHYDLLILDINAPRMSGLQVSKLLRNNNNIIPIMLIINQATIDERVLEMVTGADEYITKPFSIKETAKLIEDIVKQNKNDKNEEFLDLLFLNNMMVVKSKSNMKFTYFEYQLLYLLAKNTSSKLMEEDIQKDFPNINLNYYLKAINSKLMKIGSQYQIKSEGGYQLCLRN